ncbi:translation initiation factor IF-2 [Candidatus Parcubacteria bacterium]|nr:MAG: translation initiation factor IF-2 [Candidatus Parcubacteria bacterium]
MARTPELIERPPIVVVLGHVDHGKSTLLDFIRKSNTVEKEAGGITQHVAAYEAVHKEKRIAFIDTPGHAAFGAIRSRGANVADIAILVVAGDDGVKPQTLEALASIKEANIPFIVAINKIDKSDANIERTQASLMEKGVYLEKLGGDVPWAPISAKKGTGVDELLDLILLVAEMKELKADPVPPASGYVIETHRDPKRGIAATLIITAGSLKSGMAILAGRAISPVRILETTAGETLREASFSTPVRLVGFDELPSVGASFQAFKNKRAAEDAREELPVTQKTSVQEEEKAEHFYLPLIVRADTAGSLEAIAHEITRLGDEHSSIRIVQSGIGNIAEGDIKTAVAGTVQAAIIGFNVGIDAIAETMARQNDLPIEQFNIIYKLTERLEELLQTRRPKRILEEVMGRAKILKQFSSRKDEHVVGGSVQDGYITKGGSVRVSRRGTVIGIGKITNLQSHKQNVDRVEAGSEFGAQVQSPFEVAQGDVLECIVTKEV